MQRLANKSTRAVLRYGRATRRALCTASRPLPAIRRVEVCRSKAPEFSRPTTANPYQRRGRRALSSIASSSSQPSANIRNDSYLATQVIYERGQSQSHEGQSTQSHALVPSDAQRSTIYAVATPPGRGGVAVVRVSGPDALQVYYHMVRPSNTGVSRHKEDSTNARTGAGSGKGKGKGREIGDWMVKEPEPRRMVRCVVVDPVSGEELDDGLAVFFRGACRIVN